MMAYPRTDQHATVPLMDEALPSQRHLFSLPEDLHYLNGAYMSPLMHAVEAAGGAGLARKRVPTRITPQDFFSESSQARELFGKLVNADANRVAIIPAVSYGMATVARNMTVEPGQSIVVTHEQFPSNVYPWRRLQEQGVNVKTVRPPASFEGRGEGWNTRILEAIMPDTALVALGHVHWTDGTLFDLHAISRRAREVGAALVIDGTQSVGALPLDVQDIQPDALIVAGYKWLMGPYGLGFAYYGPRFDDGVPLEENWIARHGSEDFKRLVDYQDAYGPGALRYDVGERSNPILLPMLIAALEQLLVWTPERIQGYCANLIRGFLEEARALDCHVEVSAWRASHLFGLRLPESGSLIALQAALERHNVSVSVRGDAVRVSPHVYNDEADLNALLTALREAVGAG
jgi:selenocysteine lyase/cysteine desulfurase